MSIFRCFREYALLKPLGQRVTPIKKEWAKRANACPLSSLFWEIRSLSSFSLLRNVIQLTIRKCKDNAFQRSVFNRTARIWQIWNTFPNDLEILLLLSYYNAIVVIAIAKCQRAKILPIRASVKLPYTTLCYIASRFILPPHSLASSWDGSLAITSLQVGTTLTSFQVDTNNNDFKLFDGIWLCIACDIYIVKDKTFDREIMHQRSQEAYS